MIQTLRGQSGLTLLELVITLAAILIIAGVTLTAWSSYVPVYSLNNSSRMLASQLRLARMHAVTEEHDASVQFDVTNRSFWRWVDLNDNNTFDAGTDRVYGSVKLDHGIDFCRTCDGNSLPASTSTFNDTDDDGINFTYSDVEFTPRGTRNVASATWIFLQGVEQEQLRAVNISSTTGQVTIYKWNGTSWSE